MEYHGEYQAVFIFELFPVPSDFLLSTFLSFSLNFDFVE